MILVHGVKADPVTKEREIKSTESEREEGVKNYPVMPYISHIPYTTSPSRTHSFNDHPD